MKYAGQIEFLPRSYRGFGIAQTYWDGRDGSRKRCTCLAIFSSFEDKEVVKEVVKEQSGNWCPAGRFWWLPLSFTKASWQQTFEQAIVAATTFAQACPINLPFELGCYGEQGAKLLRVYLERGDAEAILRLERAWKDD